MQSNFAVNKHLHTVASRWMLLIYIGIVLVTVVLCTHYSCQIVMKNEFFSADFRKILESRISLKVLRVGVELFRGGQIEISKLVVALRNFLKASTTIGLGVKNRKLLCT